MPFGIADLLADGAAHERRARRRLTGAARAALSRLLRALAAVGRPARGGRAQLLVDRARRPPALRRARARSPAGPRSSGVRTTGRRGRRSSTACAPARTPSTTSTAPTPGATAAATPRTGEIFDAAMTLAHAPRRRAPARRLRLRPLRHGRRRRRQPRRAARRDPARPSRRVRGVLFDQPHVVAGAPRCSRRGRRRPLPRRRRGASSRRAGRRRRVPAQVDRARLGRRRRPPPSCGCAAAAIPPAGRHSLVVERIVAPPNEGPRREVLFSDLNMLVVLGGRERTARRSTTALFAAGGFRLVQTVASDSGLSVLEGMPLRGE